MTPRIISPRARVVSINGCIPLYLRSCRRLYSRTIFQDGDTVYLKKKLDYRASPIVVNPIVPGHKVVGRFSRHGDCVEMNDIIGKGPRDIVTTKKGTEYRIHEPTLGEYTTMSSRLVTPIYPQEANIIVSLLDLHPNPPGADRNIDEERLEIFEAGTGHGSLTLHLAKAIHCANAPAPPGLPSTSEERVQYEEWRANRRAVIHTLDTSSRYSEHAKGVVKGFRRGMYFPHVDFHVGHIGEYISSRLARNGNQPFLAHAILDLPDTDEYISILGQALSQDGCLITWNPSISQTMKCLDAVKRLGLPFHLEKVLEVGAGIPSGGKEWDVRFVKPKAKVNTEILATQDGTNAETGSENDDRPIPGAGETEVENGDPSWFASMGRKWEMISRPRVGLRLEGGGFIGLWKRKLER